MDKIEARKLVLNPSPKHLEEVTQGIPEPGQKNKTK